VLQPEDGLGVEQVRLALTAPLVLAPDGEGAVGGRDARRGVRRRVAQGHLLGEDVESDSPEGGGGAREVLLDQLVGEAECLEDLGAAVRHHGGDAHLGHHLEDALAERLDQVGHGLLLGDRHHALVDEPFRGLHREVGVHRGGTVADQQRHVVDLPHVAGLDDQRDARAGAPAERVVVDGREQQEGGDGGEFGAGVPVGEHDEADAALDGGIHLGEDLLQP